MPSNGMLKHCVVAIAGDLADPEWRAEKVKQWVEYWGGTFTSTVDNTVTHLLCTPENFKKLIPEVRTGLTNKSITDIVERDWLQDSIGQKSRLNTLPYSFFEKAKQERAKALKVEKRLKALENWETHVNPDLWHIYRDSTYFEYRVELKRDNPEENIVGEKYLTSIWESNAKPYNYIVSTIYKKPRRKSIETKLSKSPSDLDTAFKIFKAFFKKKTGISWNERIDKAGTTGPDLFQYQPPGGGKPVGLLPNAETNGTASTQAKNITTPKGNQEEGEDKMHQRHPNLRQHEPDHDSWNPAKRRRVEMTPDDLNNASPLPSDFHDNAEEDVYMDADEDDTSDDVYADAEEEPESGAAIPATEEDIARIVAEAEVEVARIRDSAAEEARARAVAVAEEVGRFRDDDAAAAEEEEARIRAASEEEEERARTEERNRRAARLQAAAEERSRIFDERAGRVQAAADEQEARITAVLEEQRRLRETAEEEERIQNFDENQVYLLLDAINQPDPTPVPVPQRQRQPRPLNFDTSYEFVYADGRTPEEHVAETRRALDRSIEREREFLAAHPGFKVLSSSSSSDEEVLRNGIINISSQNVSNPIRSAATNIYRQSSMPPPSRPVVSNNQAALIDGSVFHRVMDDMRLRLERDAEERRRREEEEEEEEEDEEDDDDDDEF
ncbi:hypothetical protein GGS20DRAFT_161387 [Poronia punctata]|nr:hypothetical protein GGS20DRAFT_161387 [Poronia punctata]